MLWLHADSELGLWNMRNAKQQRMKPPEMQRNALKVSLRVAPNSGDATERQSYYILTWARDRNEI